MRMPAPVKPAACAALALVRARCASIAGCGVVEPEGGGVAGGGATGGGVDLLPPPPPHAAKASDSEAANTLRTRDALIIAFPLAFRDRHRPDHADGRPCDGDLLYCMDTLPSAGMCRWSNGHATAGFR